MVDFRSGLATNPDGISVENTLGVDISISGVTVHPVNTINVSRGSTSSTTSTSGAGGHIPLGVTPPTITRATATLSSGRGAGGESGGPSPITITDLMERQEILAKAQTDMATTQKEVLTFLKTLTDRLPQESRQPPGPTGNTSGAGASTVQAYLNEEAYAADHTRERDQERFRERSQPSNFIIREDLERLLQNRGKENSIDAHQHQPPFPQDVQRTPLPRGYTSPEFTIYDGTDLGRISQRNNEYPNNFVKGFRTQALDYHEPDVTERQLVELCINEMIPIYRAFLGNLGCQISEPREAAQCSVTTSPALLERTRVVRSNDSRENRGNRCLINKQYDTGPFVSIVGEGRKRKAPAAKQQPKRAAPAHTVASQKGSGKTPTQDIKDTRFPFPMNEVMELLETWIQDDVVKLPRVRCPPSEKDMTDANYCCYHRFVHHPTKDCNKLKQIFREKIEAGELQLRNEGVYRDPSA